MQEDNRQFQSPGSELMEILDVPITFPFCHMITFENCTVTLNLDWEPML
jgi:hypothetical protein